MKGRVKGGRESGDGATIDGSLNGWTRESMDGWVRGSTDGWVRGSMDGWIRRSMDGWMRGPMDDGVGEWQRAGSEAGAEGWLDGGREGSTEGWAGGGSGGRGAGAHGRGGAGAHMCGADPPPAPPAPVPPVPPGAERSPARARRGRPRMGTEPRRQPPCRWESQGEPGREKLHAASPGCPCDRDGGIGAGGTARTEPGVSLWLGWGDRARTAPGVTGAGGSVPPCTWRKSSPVFPGVRESRGLGFGWGLVRWAPPCPEGAVPLAGARCKWGDRNRRRAGLACNWGRLSNPPAGRHCPGWGFSGTLGGGCPQSVSLGCPCSPCSPCLARRSRCQPWPGGAGVSPGGDGPAAVTHFGTLCLFSCAWPHGAAARGQVWGPARPRGPPCRGGVPGKCRGLSAPRPGLRQGCRQ